MAPDANIENVKAFSDAMRVVFLSMLHKHEIGDDMFDGALKLVIRGIAMQMFEEG